MSTLHRISLLGLLATLVLVGCTGEEERECVSSTDCTSGRCVDGMCVNPGADTGAPADTGVATDTGAPTDTGVATDTGAPADTGVATDTGSPLDVGPDADSGPPGDVGSTMFTLTVQISGTRPRLGRVRSTPDGIDCRSGTCTADFAAGATVTLTQLPDDCPWLMPPSCTASVDPCELLMDRDQTARAFFPRSGDLCP